MRHFGKNNQNFIIELYNHYILLRNKLISLIERNRAFIPFNSIILWYLRIPFILKLIVNLLIATISGAFIYNIGFIIVQSKAKNKILSIISAYNNYIDFPVQIYWFYSFLYLSLFLLSIFPVIVMYSFEGFVRNKLYDIINKSNKNKLGTWIFIGVAFAFVLICIFSFIINFVPYVAYYMLYESRSSTLLQLILEYLLLGKDSGIQNDFTEYQVFNNEMLIAIVYPSMLLSFSIFAIYFLKTYGKFVKNPILNALTIITPIIVFSFILLVLFFSHTAFHWGNLGKILSQFEADYISVTFKQNEQSLTLKGYRIYQKEKYIIVRDACNSLHTVESDDIHTKTITKNVYDSCQN